ncbi:S9 family peptidase [Antrihabitans sp. YC2-6]|uniref:alpha/beta hydrolase family protein n=1 Tax=Antrihabitans sp. YC2-6 TaxID=2799498 RepID=UPI001F342680|nr:alpha/beta hydrolase [Antrihabitans sp. YC2-6]
MPDNPGDQVPAFLLIAGSGPTDRNGDSVILPGSIGTLDFLADELARNGFASLRFDKLGTGATGVGGLTNEDIGQLGFDALINEAADALRFLAAQDGVDESRLGAMGHSEGALIALALATGKAGDVPALTSLALVQPASERILDTLTRQITAQIDTAVGGGALPPEEGDALRDALSGAVAELRADGTVPDNLPPPLQNAGLVPLNAKALAGEDRLDPIVLAGEVKPGTPVLTSCSAKDIQVRCEDVDRLDAALAQTTLTAIKLTDTNHVLKVVGDRPSTGAEYVEPLPFSPQFATDLSGWLKAL